MEAVCFFETLASAYGSTRRQNPEHYYHIHRLKTSSFSDVAYKRWYLHRTLQSLSSGQGIVSKQNIPAPTALAIEQTTDRPCVLELFTICLIRHRNAF
jgi:hypothetical protein